MIPLSRPRPGALSSGGFRSRLMKGPRASRIAGKERSLGGAANVVKASLSSGMAGAAKKFGASARSRAAEALSKKPTLGGGGVA